MRLRRVPALYWILAVGLAACTSVTIFRLAAAADARARYWGTHAQVPVVVRPVAAGASIDPSDFEIRSVPESLLPQSKVASDPAGLTAIVPLLPGEVLVEAKLAPAGVEGAAALLEPGQRAVAVPRNETTPPVQVGDRVDVILTLDATGATGGPPAFAIARAAMVVHVNDAAVTLAVPAADAAKVAFGAAQSAVALAVSSPDDWGSAASDGDRDDDAAGDYAIHDEGGEATPADETQQPPYGGEPGDGGGAHAHSESGGEPGGQPAAPQ